MRRVGDIPVFSAWILRVGVISSAALMVAGLTLSALHGGLSIQAMRSVRLRPDAGLILGGLLRLDGTAFLDAGVLLLVLTPIARVAASTALFAFEEHDRLYTAFTFGVLCLTLLSLLFLR